MYVNVGNSNIMKTPNVFYATELEHHIIVMIL